MSEVYLSRFKVLSGTDRIVFDCEDEDLNDFFCKDAVTHQTHFLSKTYYCTDDNGEIVVMFSVCNDSIKLPEDRKKIFPKNKWFKSYSAVKLARLGVSSKFKRKGIGTQAIDFLKCLFVVGNKAGCRFLTVDAYNKEETLSFYKRNGFAHLTEKDKSKETRTMFLDLFPFYQGVTPEMLEAIKESMRELVGR